MSGPTCPRAKRSVPVLLNIHGGPATQYGYTFFDEFQVLHRSRIRSHRLQSPGGERAGG